MALDSLTINTALQQIAIFPSQVTKAASSSSAVYLGPWSIQVSCGYGSNKHANYNYASNFSSARSQIVATLGSINGSAHALNTATTDSITALKSSAPEVLNQLNALKTALSQSGYPEKAQVIKQLKTLVSAIQQLVSGLKQGTANVAADGNLINQATSQLNSIVSSSINGMSQLLTSVRSKISFQNCGKESATAQLIGWVTLFTIATQQLQSIFATFDAQASQVSNDVGMMIGQFDTFQINLGGIAQQLDLAQDSAAYDRAITLLHIDISIGKWTEIAQKVAGL